MFSQSIHHARNVSVRTTSNALTVKLKTVATEYRYPENVESIVDVEVYIFGNGHHKAGDSTPRDLLKMLRDAADAELQRLERDDAAEVALMRRDMGQDDV